MLQDVEDIMANQMSDIFQLSSWVAAIADMFDLRVCNKQEWKEFSNHYNWVMGEVTANTPSYETTSTDNDSPMIEADRDELLKAHEELDTARTTIKNLSEAVVNFSHTRNALAHQQEKEEEAPQPATHQANPQTNTTHTSPCWTKSANPTVIVPTWNIKPKAPQPAAESTPKPKANPHQLILQFNPPIPETERKNADIAHKDINNLLDSLEVPTYFHAMAVNWSRNSNPVVTTTASCTAGDLLGHAEKIGKVFTANTLISALLDIEYFCIKINMISMKDYEGNVCNSREVHKELMEYVMVHDKLQHASTPCWLGNQEYLEVKSHSSMVFSFTTAEDRDKLIGYRPIWVFNQHCTTTLYEDHLHIFACHHCG